MNFCATFPDLEPKERFPSAHEFFTVAAERILGGNPCIEVLLDKEVHELSDPEKWAICFFAKVPMRLEKGESPEKIVMVTDCDVGIQKIDGKFRVLISQDSLPKPYQHFWP